MKAIKSIIGLALAAILVMPSISSCSSHKIADAKYKGKELQEKSRSQQLAEAKPATRAYGSGIFSTEAFARQYAENMARDEFGRKLTTIVQSAIRQSTDGARMFSSDSKKGATAEDQGILSNSFAESVANNEVTNVIIINTDTYKLKDGQYQAFVCVEWMGDSQDLANVMTKNFKSKVEQQVSDEDRAKMEVRYEDFRKSVEEQLRRMQNLK